MWEALRRIVFVCPARSSTCCLIVSFFFFLANQELNIPWLFSSCYRLSRQLAVLQLFHFSLPPQIIVLETQLDFRVQKNRSHFIIIGCHALWTKEFPSSFTSSNRLSSFDCSWKAWYLTKHAWIHVFLQMHGQKMWYLVHQGHQVSGSSFKNEAPHKSVRPTPEIPVKTKTHEHLKVASYEWL